MAVLHDAAGDNGVLGDVLCRTITDVSGELPSQCRRMHGELLRTHL